MFTLSLLGAPALSGTRGKLNGRSTQRRRLAFLALVANSGERGIARERVASYLWPDCEAKQARHLVADSLSVIRRDLGEDAIVASSDQLWCNEQVLETDVVIFRRALAEGRGELAVSRYSGPFLDGFHIENAAEFERWAEETRVNLACQLASALDTLAKSAATRGDLSGAVEWSRRLVGHDPFSSRFAIAYMRNLVGAGDRAAAVQHARVHELLLRQELDAEPDVAFRDFVASLTKPSAPHQYSSHDRDRPSNFVAVTRAQAKTPNESQSTHDIDIPPPISHVLLTDGGVHSAKSTAANRFSLATRYARKTVAVFVGSLGVAVLTLFALALRGAASGRGVSLVRPTAARTTDARSDSLATVRERVMLAPLDLQSGQQLGDAGDLLRNAIASSLAREDGVDLIVADSQVGVSTDVGRREPLRADTSLLNTARSRGADLVMLATLRRDSASLRAQFDLIDVGSGARIWVDRPSIVGDPPSVDSVAKLAERIAGAVASAGDPFFRGAMPLSSTAPTLGSFVAFQTAVRLNFREDYPAAIHYLHVAMRDSTFSLPVIFLAFEYFQAGDCRRTDSIAAAVLQRREQLRRWDRLFLDRTLARCHGQWDVALQNAREAIRIAPHSEWAAGVMRDALFEAGRPAALVAEADSGLFQPASRAMMTRVGFYTDALYNSLHVLGRYDRELTEVRRLKPLVGESAVIAEGELEGEIQALAALHRVDELRSVVSSSLTMTPLPVRRSGTMLRLAALELIAHGDSADARQFQDEALTWYHDRPPAEQATEEYQSSFASALMEAGHLAAARGLYTKLAEAYPDSLDFHGALGVIAARSSNRDAAMHFDNWLAEHSSGYSDAPCELWRARIATRLGERERALSFLRDVRARQAFSIDLHRIIDWESVHGDADFERLLEPRG